MIDVMVSQEVLMAHQCQAMAHFEMGHVKQKGSFFALICCQEGQHMIILFFSSR
jgi:hypothetical protein